MIICEVAMKRDMDLIRKILLVVESEVHGFAPEKLEIDGYTQEQIEYHAVLLGEAGLAEVVDMTTYADKSPQGKIIRLTWLGHEFVDSARENQVWNQAKDLIINKVGGATIQIWMLVLAGYIKTTLGIT